MSKAYHYIVKSVQIVNKLRVDSKTVKHKHKGISKKSSDNINLLIKSRMGPDVAKLVASATLYQ